MGASAGGEKKVHLPNRTAAGHAWLWRALPTNTLVPRWGSSPLSALFKSISPSPSSQVMRQEKSQACYVTRAPITSNPQYIRPITQSQATTLYFASTRTQLPVRPEPPTPHPPATNVTHILLKSSR